MDNYTFKFRDDGLILGADQDPNDPLAAFLDVTQIDGLDNAPFRSTERDREGQDGGFVDAEYERIRTIVIEGTAYASVDTILQYLDRLKGNFGPVKVPQPFYFQAPSLTERVVFCKSYGVRYSWETALRTGTTPVQIQLVAEDPTIYDSIPFSGSAGLPAAGGGRSYPKSYNYGYNNASGGYTDDYGDAFDDIYGDTTGGASPDASGGYVTVTNGGNKDTGAIITIYGPIDNPAVSHDATDRQLRFNISLLSNQYLTIDLRNRTVMLNGTTNRRHTMTGDSRWFLFPPGSSSLKLLGNDPISGAPDPAMTVVTRGAYR